MGLMPILHSNRGMDMSWLIYAILGVILLGAAPVFAKSGMRKCSSDFTAAVYGTALFIAVNCMVSFTGTSLDLSQMEKTAFMYLLFSGIAIGASWVCCFRALKRAPINAVIPVLEASLIIEIIAGIVIFGDGLSVNKIVILVLLTAGTICMALQTNRKRKRTKKRKGMWLSYALGAMLFIGLATIFGRIGLCDIDEYMKSLICYAVALIMVWVVTFATGSQIAMRSISFLDGICVILSGACVGGAQFCFYKAKLLSGGFHIEIIALFDLAAAVLFGYVFMKEQLSTKKVFGMILMLAGFLFWHMNLPEIPL